jgi:diguanylate cyclase (GGDEF)-like protein
MRAMREDSRQEAGQGNPAPDAERDTSCHRDGRNGLTGELNRDSFIFRASIDLCAAFAQGKRCCLAIADLDQLEDFNDRYGRLAGDEALEYTAKVISARMRKTDFMGRWGGEAFALFFQDMEINTCCMACGQILQNLTVTPLKLWGKPVYITASIGVTTADPDEFGINAEGFRFLTDDGTGVIERLAGRAEKALCEAKRKGRSWVVSSNTVNNEQ